MNTSGDGFLAMFDGPQRAIRCAMAIRDAVQSLGIEVRAGLHTGECEIRGDDIGGIAVHIGARVSALAGPNDVLVSSTLRDLVIGSGLEFEERGAHDSKAFPANGTYSPSPRRCGIGHTHSPAGQGGQVVSGGRHSLRDSVQFCSGLVDLVVCVGRHFGGGHRLALAGKRFVGLVAERVAEVCDGGGQLWDCRRGQGTERETGDGGCRFEASEAVEEYRESCQGETDVGDVAES